MGGSQSSNQPYSVPIEGSKTPGFSAVYRNQKTLKGLTSTPSVDCKSMKDVYIKCCTKKYKNKDYIGQVILTKNGDLQQRKVIKFTYMQMFQMAENLGSNVYSQKLTRQQKQFGMNMIGVYSKNRYEWIVSDIACVLYGFTIVPLYDTLGIQNLTYCLEHSEITTCFITQATAKTLATLKGHGQLRNLISYDPLPNDLVNQLKGLNFNIMYFQDLAKKPQNYITHQSINPPTNSCLTFSYTSGTTGPPKGAMLSHQNFLGFLSAFLSHQINGFREDDVYVSFLPLPHVFQRVVQAAIAYSGAFCAFFNGDVNKLKDDLAFVKPTIFIGVPRIFNRIVEGVQKKFSETSGIKKCIVNSGMNSKTDSLHKQGYYSSGFYDKVVFSQVSEGFGGNIRLMITGSAPIKKDVFEFMKIVMSCPFYEGYGQTQNTAAAFINEAIDPLAGHVGGIISSLEFKLMDIPQMQYTSDDKDQDGKPTPRGQIWLRGPSVFMGYYKDPQKTQEALTQDGWLKTGDVGMIIPHRNAMKIIDRKKNIFKLQQGQYVAAEKVEAIYSKSHLITQVFLHGESTHNHAVAIVTVGKDQLQAIAKNNGISKPYHQLTNDKQIRTLVCKQLNSIGKKQGLHGFEQAKNVYIEPENFQARDILTNTLKLQRFAAKKYYAKQIADMYNEPTLV